jgi:adenosylmethionine-8-amino-7-oxononanoate aminotransferase
MTGILNSKQTDRTADFKQLIRRDKQLVWHPYTSMPDTTPVFPVVSAQGCRITLADGRELIDGMASWWCAIHGYNHPALNEAMNTQLQSMAHVMFGGLTHEPAIELAEELVRITPPGLDKVFFCDSGSVSVEVAMKMAIQFHQSINQPRKNRFLTIRNGYHGDTIGAMSVCDPVTGMHSLFSKVLQKQHFAERPRIAYHSAWDEYDIDSFKKQLLEHHEEIAAVIMEPIVQGAGGMWFYHPEYLRCVRNLCNEYEILLILDEIATGFGRSGRMFACEHADVVPDIMCLGKAISGGYMSFAATLATEQVAQIISQADPGTFMHGPTFMANALACSVSLANISLLHSWPWQEKTRDMDTRMREALLPCREYHGVADVRVLGAIAVVELESQVDISKITPEFVNQGVWIRPFSNLIYIMPPYIIEEEELNRLTESICNVVSRINEFLR